MKHLFAINRQPREKERTKCTTAGQTNSARSAWNYLLIYSFFNRIPDSYMWSFFRIMLYLFIYSLNLSDPPGMVISYKKATAEINIDDERPV